MPRFDGTGPNGKGPETGRGVGPCEPEKKVSEVEKEDKKKK